MTVLPMYGSLPYYRQIKVFQIDRNVRKVVLATNIAETSVTIPGIVYVVDSGFHKLPQYDVSLGLELLRVCVVSRHNAVQRAGRAGRTSAGKCYRSVCRLLTIKMKLITSGTSPARAARSLHGVVSGHDTHAQQLQAERDVVLRQLVEAAVHHWNRYGRAVQLHRLYSNTVRFD
nr:probable ATP-dependent RNA helicase DHX35 [Danaus plexippus plexippus]